MTEDFDAKEFFLSAKGRLNRQPYNIAFIITFLACLLLYMAFQKTVMNVHPTTLSSVQQSVAGVCNEKSKKYYSPGTQIYNVYLQNCVEEETFSKLMYSSPKSIILLVIGFLLYLVMICPTIKRLHDRGKSGWWYLGFMVAAFIPLINIVAPIWLLVETSFLRGTVGSNDYGPDPLA